ncbi:hypothetical protein HMPREF0322_05027 [Desulfitobacterium hafniense DP7]|uniref:Uncharacterized protein n=1 Tax=Desulfitobacterium hafniense DP7 TaxID=537010 RepID=G9XW44_DESHA|nr:hypothetical protein HMPREF0322_05027 [Desulfitobacterium hafniense DP7]
MHTIGPKSGPKDFTLQKGNDFKRAASRSSLKFSTEKGWKQDVSNPL